MEGSTREGGQYGSEPWDNPYLLAPDHARQEKFFRDEMKAARAVILNTKKQTIQETYETIVRHLDQA